MLELDATVLTVEQLAKLVHKSPSSIRSDASRNPSSLPPICRLPGCKRLLWRLEDVHAWMASYVDRTATVIATPSQELAASLTRKRGRPRKTERGH